MKSIAILCAALAAACTSVQVPPCSVASEWGVARAATPELAEQLSESIAGLAPRIVAAVPGMTTNPADVRLVDRVGPYRSFDVPGASIETPSARWIEIRRSDPQPFPEDTLAHELVHLWLGPDWDTLPPVMEDGLANLVEMTLVPASAPRRRLQFAVAMSTSLFGALRVDGCGMPIGRREGPLSYSLQIPSRKNGIPGVRESLAMDTATYQSESDLLRMAEIVAFSSMLASRIGIERLHGLCVRARRDGLHRVPPDWILGAAGLPTDDPQIWEIAILEMYGPAEREVLVHSPAWPGFFGKNGPPVLALRPADRN